MSLDLPASRVDARLVGVALGAWLAAGLAVAWRPEVTLLAAGVAAGVLVPALIVARRLSSLGGGGAADRLSAPSASQRSSSQRTIGQRTIGRRSVSQRGAGERGVRQQSAGQRGAGERGVRQQSAGQRGVRQGSARRAQRGEPGWLAVASTVVVQLGLVSGAVAAALVSSAGQVAARTDGVAAELIEHQATVTVTAEVRAPPHRVRATSFSPEPRFAVAITATELSGRGIRGGSQAPLLVVGDAAWSALVPGQVIEATGKLETADPGERTVAYLRPIRPPRTMAAPVGVAAAAEHVRARLRAACVGLPPDAAGLLPGLVVGDTSQLPTDLDEAMRTTGLTHLTAVSGANITIVAGAVLFLLTATGIKRLPRLVWAGLAVLVFVIVAGPEPSVLRAAVMGVVGLVGLAVSRPGAGLPPLCVAIATLVLADPWLARAPGFALSVLATGGLVLLARPLSHRLERVLPRWLAIALAVPLAAQAAVGPVSVLLQPALPAWVLPANMLVEPVVAPVTVLGALAAVVGLVSEPAAHALVWLAGWPLRWVSLVARTGAALPGASVPWPAGVPGAVLLGVVTIALMAVLFWGLGRMPVRGSGAQHQSAGWPQLVVVLASVTAIVVAVALVWPRARSWLTSWPPPGWTIVACAVGQGTSVVIRTGPGSAMLIDAGPDPALVDGCLSRLGVQHLDLVVLSHFHADHVDGLPGVLRGRTVEAALVTTLDEPAANARTTLSALEAAGVPTSVAGAGVSGSAGDAEYEVIGPTRVPGSTHGSASSEEGSAPNNASLALRLQVGGLSVLSLGDAELEEQRDVLRTLAGRPELSPVDVVVVAHHGSAKQVGELYEALAPRVALITVGADNDYGHPAAPTMALLARLGIRVLRTDTCGDSAVLDTDAGPGIALATRCASSG